MLVMGIDTSSDIGAVGLCNENGIIGEINIHLFHRHSEELLTNIDFLLNQSGYTIGEIEGLSVTIGPGSFTGLRIGLSTVKAFAQVFKIPVLGVSTLDLLAYNTTIDKSWLVPAIDARHRRVYTALYRNRQCDIRSSKRWPDRAMTVDDLLKELQDNDPDGVYYIIGDGSLAYREQFEKSPLDIKFVPAGFNIPRGGFLAEIGRFYIQKGVSDNYIELKPNYLKKPQAEINWQKRHSTGE